MTETERQDFIAAKCEDIRDQEALERAMQNLSQAERHKVRRATLIAAGKLKPDAAWAEAVKKTREYLETTEVAVRSIAFEDAHLCAYAARGCAVETTELLDAVMEVK
jgi:hypothetical protein